MLLDTTKKGGRVLSKIRFVVTSPLREGFDDPSSWDGWLGVVDPEHPDTAVRGVPAFSWQGAWRRLLFEGHPLAEGQRGLDGSRGAAGPQGPAGSTGPTGLQGAQGSQGPAGVSGTSGARGATGPAGARGATGSAGSAGVSGRSGASGAPGGGVNLVQNPSLERGDGVGTLGSVRTPGWSAAGADGTVVVSDELPHSGSRHATLAPPVGEWAELRSDYVPIDRALAHHATFRLSSASVASGSSSVEVVLDCYSAGRTLVERRLLASRSVSSLPTSTYERVGASVSAGALPSATREVCLVVRVSSIGASAAVRADFAQLTIGADARTETEGVGSRGVDGQPVNLLPNPGFEEASGQYLGPLSDTDVASWEGIGTALARATGSAGAAFVSLVSEDGEPGGVLSDFVGVSADLPYRFSARAKLGDGSTGDLASRVRFSARAYDGARAELGRSTFFEASVSELGAEYSDLSAVVPASAWPAGTEEARIEVSVESAPQTLGPELVTNGGFATDLSGWTAGGGWAASAGEARYSGSAASALSQDVAATAGALHRVSAASSWSSGGSVWFSGSLGDATFGFASGSGLLAFVAPSTGVTLAFEGQATTPGVASVDDVSVKRVLAQGYEVVDVTRVQLTQGEDEWPWARGVGVSGRSGAPGDCPNLIANSGFEDGSGAANVGPGFAGTTCPGWSSDGDLLPEALPGEATVTEWSPRSGKRCVFLTSRDGEPRNLRALPVSVDASSDYDLSLYLMNGIGDRSPLATLRVMLDLYAAGGTYLQTNVYWESTLEALAAPTEWTRSSFALRASQWPVGVTDAQLVVQIASAAGVGTLEEIYVDDAQLTRGNGTRAYSRGPIVGHPGQPVNLVPNHSFEDGPGGTVTNDDLSVSPVTGWSRRFAYGTCSLASASNQSRSGPRSLRAGCSDGGSVGAGSDYVAIDRTQSYLFSAWYKRAWTTASAGNKAVFQLDEYDRARTLLASREKIVGWGDDGLSLASGWLRETFLSAGSSFHADAVEVRLLLRAESATTDALEQVVWFDDVSLTPGPTAWPAARGVGAVGASGRSGAAGQPVNLVPNHSFEDGASTLDAAHWTGLSGTGCVRDSADRRSGTYSVKFYDKTSNSQTIVSDQIGVGGGELYVASCWAEASWASVDPANVLSLIVTERDSAGLTTATQTLVLSSGPDGGCAWTQFFFDMAATQATTVSVTLAVEMTTETDNVYQTCHVDDVCLTLGAGHWPASQGVGTTGRSGTSGQVGTSGTTGRSGTSGQVGTSGTTGRSGYSGAVGAAGSAGASGVSGVVGTSGLSGRSGVAGSAGASGVSGVAGTAGTAGASGTTGFSGTTGKSGYSGAGASGTSGYSGGGGSLSKTVSQVAHGFNVGKAVYFDGANYQLADASDENKLGLWVVSRVDGPDSFDVQQAGYVSGLTGLTAGQYYYVSDATPGALTSVEPNVVSNPLLFAIGTTEGYVLPFRPAGVGTSGYSGTSGVEGAPGGTSGYSGTSGSIGTSGRSGYSGFAASIQALQALVPGDATVGTNKLGAPLVVPFGATAVKARAHAGTGPTGADLTIDVNKNGATMLSSLLTITAGQTSGTTTSFSDASLAAGDVVTVDFDQVGSTIAGADVTVVLVFDRTGSY